MSVKYARTPIVLALLKGCGVLRGESVQFAQVARERGIVWGDACRGLPVKSNSLEVIYASHVLEHLSKVKVRQFLTELRRILKPGGVIRLAVPDLLRRAEKYRRDQDADAFMHSLNLTDLELTSMKARLRFLALGDRQHRWMYDAKSLAKLLESYGFVDAAEMPVGTTRIPNPSTLNLREREEESIYVEAVKPA